MRGKRQDFVKRVMTAFMAVIVAVSFPATLSGNSVKIKTTFHKEEKKIVYRVENDLEFTDFHIRFSAPALKPSDFTTPGQPTGWIKPNVRKQGNDIVVSWEDGDGMDAVKIGEFVLGLPNQKNLICAGNTDWEITNDKGAGTPFDGNDDGVIDSKRNDPDLGHLAIFRPESPFNFGFGLNGGWSSWALGDFGLSKNYFENLNEIPGYSATTKDLSSSPFGEFDLILEYNFPNYHKLGLSAGFQYFPGGTFEQSWSYQDTTSTSKLDISAYAIPVELFYKHRVARNLYLRIGGGATFYNAAIDYNTSFRISGQEYYYMGKLKDSGLGGHVSLGAEYSLNKNLSLSIDAGYAFAKLNNLTGTLKDRDGTGTEMLLTMARDEFGEMISIYPTAEPLPVHSRLAEIDFSGFKISFGVLFKFVGPVSPPPPEPKDDEKIWREIAKNCNRTARKHELSAEEAYENEDYLKAGELWIKAASSWAYARECNEKAGNITEAKRAWKKAAMAYANANRAFSKAVRAEENDADAWEKYAKALDDYAESLDKLAKTLDGLKKNKDANEARRVAGEARGLSAKAKAKANKKQ